MALHDISRPLSPQTACWPGDTATSLKRLLNLAEGASVNLSTLTASVHNATHADAPLHYDEEGAAIEQLDLSIYLGPCLVIDARGRDPIPAELFGRALPPRVLIRTDVWRDSSAFPSDFPVLSLEVPRLLGERGVKLVGLDVPSVDKPTSTSLPVHHALRDASVLIIESLDLSRIEPGEYELIALPILIPGSDGAFVRAALRD